MNMNIYSIAFPFNGEYQYTTMTANHLAMDVAMNIMGDCMLESALDVKQDFGYRFQIGEKYYLAAFAYDDSVSLNVYETIGMDPDAEEYDEHIVARNIPYIILKVTNGNDVIFNIADYL